MAGLSPNSLGAATTSFEAPVKPSMRAPGLRLQLPSPASADSAVRDHSSPFQVQEAGLDCLVDLSLTGSTAGGRLLITMSPRKVASEGPLEEELVHQLNHAG